MDSSAIFPTITQRIIPKNPDDFYVQSKETILQSQTQALTADFNAFPLTEKELTNNGVELRDQEDGVVQKPEYKMQIVWLNVFGIGLVHLLAVCGFLCLASIKRATFWYFIVMTFLTATGIQAGVHRLWAHRTYKANFGLRLFLAYTFMMGLQNDIYTWVRDHRAHHKFAETDADPHDIRRGFFFSHVGCFLVRKHPEVMRRGATINLDDIKADPIAMFTKQYYYPLGLVAWGIVPAAIPILGWNENKILAILVCVFSRHCYMLTTTWLANSWSHMYGTRPYDGRLAATESSIRHIMQGEGFHNYHHAFPWDYSASEMGPKSVFNPMTALINLFAWFGWAYDLKKVNSNIVEAKSKSKGYDKVNYRSHGGLYEWAIGVPVVLSPVLIPLWAMMAIQHFYGKQAI